MALIVSGFGFRPAISRAGSTPGVSKKSRKTSTDRTSMTAISPSSRRMMNVTMPYFILTFEREHRQHYEDARHDRDPRPRVEQCLPVLDDRPPARLRRLDPDREIRERRLGQ